MDHPREIPRQQGLHLPNHLRGFCPHHYKLGHSHHYRSKCVRETVMFTLRPGSAYHTHPISEMRYWGGKARFVVSYDLMGDLSRIRPFSLPLDSALRFRERVYVNSKGLRSQGIASYAFGCLVGSGSVPAIRGDETVIQVERKNLQIPICSSTLGSI